MSFKMILYVVIFLSIISVSVTETDGVNTAPLKENDNNPTKPQTETKPESLEDQKNTYELVVQFLPLENGTLIIPDVEIMFKYPWDDMSNENNNNTETEAEREKSEEAEKPQNQSNAMYNPVPSQLETAEAQQNLTSLDNSTTPTLSPEEIINNPKVLQVLKDLIADEVKKIKMEDDRQKEPRTRPTRKTTISPNLGEQSITKLPITIPPKYAEQPITETTTTSPQPGKPPVSIITTISPRLINQPQTGTTFPPKLRKQPEARTTTISPKSRKSQGMPNSPIITASTYADPFDPNCYYSTEVNPDESPQKTESLICMHCCPLELYDQYYTDYAYYIGIENTDLVYCNMVSDRACI
ncbi:probable serine/threonine-protein kinase DDB_G0275165 [Teleopsis dalmanni]|uniref:probable serine/threonine-protein kinase DDB_G0275165 n=1 Tax=Teleopsis dalmanni TaxID=139649 RepID=UPI0018CFD3F1|nr:probable serine/threonine-protein kinase DDB_G0275165 [Teleopsis dalmanni]